MIFLIDQKIQIIEPRIFFNENNDKSISFYKKINNIIKPNKRNLNYIDVCNNNQNNNYKIKNILFKKNSNFSDYKNNIGKLNSFNDKNQEVENYKKSFKSNKSKDFIFQKYLKTLK